MRITIELDKVGSRVFAHVNLKNVYHYEASGVTENETLHNLVDQLFPLPREETKKRT